jgi:cytidylate kinase
MDSKYCTSCGMGPRGRTPKSRQSYSSDMKGSSQTLACLIGQSVMPIGWRLRTSSSILRSATNPISMRIAISGLSGCGNTTVGALIAASLGYSLCNYTFRDLARDLGIDLEDIIGADRIDIFDLLVVVATVRAARGDNVVISNRLAAWVSQADLNIWLHATLTTRSTRISMREHQPYEVALAQTLARDEGNRQRFLRLFGLDVHEHGHIDAVINTELLKAEQVAAVIAALARTLQNPTSRRSANNERILALLEERLQFPRAVIVGASGEVGLKALFEKCMAAKNVQYE